MKLVLVVPIYNEEGNVADFFRECEKSLSSIKKNVEIIFVNSNSTDGTLNELKKLLNKKTKLQIKVINLSRNFGKEAAMYAGLKNANLEKDDYLAIIDSDLQQPPELLLKMINILDNFLEYDEVCYFQDRRIEGKFISILKSKFYKIIRKSSHLDIVDGASDFRMFRSNVVEAILMVEEKNRFSKGIFSWVGFNIKYLPYTPQKRLNGKSKYDTKSLFNYGISGIFSFSNLLVHLIIYCGLLCLLISIIYFIVLLVQKLCYSISISGYSLVILCIFLVGGLILLALGVTCKYISDIYIEVKNRPIYIEKEIIRSEGRK